MLSFRFKRSCPLVGSPSAAYPSRPFRRSGAAITNLVGHRFEEGGAPFRLRPEKCPTSRRNSRPTCVVTAPHFPRNQCPTSPGIRNLILFGVKRP